MNFSYSDLIRKADNYLRSKRTRSRLWRRLLPERIFAPELWHWKARSVSTGAAWGAFWAIAPVPLQSVFAVLTAMRARGNIPVALAFCWISFPGYQIIVWPAQWWIGHRCLALFGAESPFSYRLAKQAVLHISNQPSSITPEEIGSFLPHVGAELLLGCLITCPLTALLVGVTTYALFRLFHRGKTE